MRQASTGIGPRVLGQFLRRHAPDSPRWRYRSAGAGACALGGTAGEVARVQDSDVRIAQGVGVRESGSELVVMVGPPAAPAGVAFAATGPVPHLDGVRVTGIDAAPDGCFDSVDGIVYRGEQLCPPVGVQSVGVGGDRSRAGRSAGRQPSRAWSKSSSMGTQGRARWARSKTGRPGAAKSKSSSASAVPSRKTTFSGHTSL
jgi:hypothetical protein